MVTLLITILDVVIKCVGLSCQQASFIEFRQLLSSGLLELVIEVPVFLGIKTAITNLKIYRRKEGEYVDDNDAGGQRQ